MAIQQNYPNIVPSLSLDFAAVQALDPRITFSRASTATYYGTETAKAEENLLIHSQEFETTWGNLNTTDTANTEAAPNGTTTADTITASGAGSLAHSVFQSITPPSGTNVFSVFAKAGTNDYIQLLLGNQAGTFANFDVTAGAGATGTSGGVISTSITSVGNDWFRCVMIFTQSNANNVQIGLVTSDAAARAEFWTAAGTETVFLWGAQLEQRSAVTNYTPTTTQPITNYIPVLESAASGVARFDHNPTTFESLGLLIEEQRTNLLLRSEEFNTGWSAPAGSILVDQIAAPSGQITADAYIENTTSGTARSCIATASSVSFVSGTTYTQSVYAKNGTGSQRFLQLCLSGTAFTALPNANFNLTTGTFTATSSGNSASFAITSVGNGWYRCSITATADGSVAATPFVLMQSLSTAARFANYTGDGFSGLFLWGAQLEVGAFATSYIPTVASQVTRAADAASMTGANFSSWYRADEGTLYAEATAGGSSTSDESSIAVSDGTNSNAISMSWIGLPFNRWNASIFTGGVIQTSGINQATNGTPRNTSRRVAVAYKINDVIAAYGGTISANDTSATLPVVDRFFIGTSGAGNNRHMNGPIAKIAFYPLRVTNEQLTALTS